MRNIITYLFLILFLAGCQSPRFGNSPETEKLNFLVEKAEKASQKENYIKAVQCYVDAILEAEEVAPQYVHDVKVDLASVYLDWARSLYWEAKKHHSAKSCYRAINMAERAAEIDPKREVRCRLLIDKLKQELATIKYKNAIDRESLDPNNKARAMKIALLSKQAAIFMESRQFTQSRDRYEEILTIDPYNLEAIRGLKKVMNEIKKAGIARSKAIEAETMAEIEWQYAQVIAEKEKKANQSNSTKEAAENLESKLNNCIIDKIDFKDLPLEEVFNQLENKISKTLNNFKFEFKEFSPKDKKFPPVSFKCSEIPANEAIKLICQGVGLDFSYSKNSLIIFPRKNK